MKHFDSATLLQINSDTDDSNSVFNENSYSHIKKIPPIKNYVYFFSKNYQKAEMNFVKSQKSI